MKGRGEGRGREGDDTDIGNGTCEGGFWGGILCAKEAIHDAPWL